MRIKPVTAVFLGLELALYAAFLALDLTGQGGATIWLKYAGVLLCLLNLLFWSLEQVNVLFIAGLTAVLLCCLFPLHPFVVRYRRLQDPLPPGRRRGADGKKGGKTG